MKKIMKKTFLISVLRLGAAGFWLALMGSASWAQEAAPSSPGKLLPLAGVRPGGNSTFWWMPREGASHTVLLISGGAGGMGYDGKQPTSDNFLIRTRDLFAAQGFNVAILGLAADMRNLNEAARISADHARDVLAVVQSVQQKSPVPVWLVGTSMGTISAASTAILDQGQTVAGVVLTSGFSPMILRLQDGPQGKQGLEAIKVPVLTLHHKDDACRITPARGVAQIVPALSASPVKKLILVEGGGPPSGDPCQPRGYHGFVGMEPQAVALIAGWIKQPQN
jgi:pimeloyl-ACP methyl ester carboxylesterase